MNIKIKLTILGLALFLGGTAIQEHYKADTKKTIPTVGVLQFMTHPALHQIYTGIEEGLADEGYQDGENIKIDFQNAQGDQSNLKTMSTRFASKKVDLAVGIATPAAISLANTIQKQPVIFAGSTNPIGSKLVTNYDHPTGNVTGVSDQAPLSDQIEMMKKILPNLNTVGVLYTSSDDSATIEAHKFQKLAQQKGLATKVASVASSNDINQTVLQLISNHQVDALFIPTDNNIAGAMNTVIKNTNAAKVPVFPTVDTMVQQGGLAAEAINQKEIGIKTGRMIGRILSGKSVQDQSVEFMQQGHLVINQKQAEKLGISIPNELMQKAKIINSKE
ncbi:tryptophan ABC transporter substrate-binding protein [Weissella koreensis]|uniref:tryptophan ABC transporter substrate-binding protein n=1 Tax=Weissella koreensis TaxID=165096 RepID=UPI0022BA6DC4|nr:tryptophan ABC transporter substrate-binding protein [Weissella koreensis]MCZ9310734.1 tryptophan ABC transporter substrate-binding protein [Weissella koreensis]